MGRRHMRIEEQLPCTLHLKVKESEYRKLMDEKRELEEKIGGIEISLSSFLRKKVFRK